MTWTDKPDFMQQAPRGDSVLRDLAGTGPSSERFLDHVRGQVPDCDIDSRPGVARDRL